MSKQTKHKPTELILNEESFPAIDDNFSSKAVAKSKPKEKMAV